MAIPESIKKLANDIRTKVYGREVRESLAKGIEEVGDIAEKTRTRQDELEVQFQSVLNETTEKDIVSAPEILAARVSAEGTQYSNLKERLDKEYQEVTTQLSDLEQEINDTQRELTEVTNEIENINIPNAQQRLILPSAYGDYEAFHPKMVMFDEQWNGYRYWIVFTPYPGGDQTKENPHLLASNDLVNWVEPAGFTNPLEPQPTGNPSSQYNSDTHILYNPVLNRLEVFWRYIDDDLDQVTIYRKHSTNGVSWSSKEVILQATRSVQDYVSPAVIFDEGKYKMWFVANGYRVWYIESSTGNNGSWSVPREIIIPYDTPMNNWHLDVIHTDVGYEIFVTAFKNGQDRNTMTLFYSVSEDNIVYSTAVPLLKPSTLLNRWDNQGIYRAGVTKFEGKYYILYCAVSKNWSRGTGLTVGGEQLKHLVGMDHAFLPQFENSQVFVRRTLTIGMTNSGEDYKVFFNQEYRDANNEFNNSIFTPKKSGIYLITGYYVFSNKAENNSYVKLYENGVYQRALGGGTDGQVYNFSRLVYLKAGRQYDFYVSQTSGTSKTVNDFNLEIVKIL